MTVKELEAYLDRVLDKDADVKIFQEGLEILEIIYSTKTNIITKNSSATLLLVPVIVGDIK